MFTSDPMQVGCLIMAGAGGRAFCAGGDVQMIREDSLLVQMEHFVVFFPSLLRSTIKTGGTCEGSLFVYSIPLDRKWKWQH